MPTRTSYVESVPGFVADRESLDHDGGHQIDWAQVGEENRATPGQIVTMGAAASAGATSLTVEALTYPVPSGTVLNFTGAGEFAITTAPAAAGATTIAVEAIDAAIEDDDTATVAGSGSKFLPAGTPMGGGASYLGGGPLWPRSATNPAVCLLATDAWEDGRTAAITGYGAILGGVIYENLLPTATGSPKRLPSAVRTELQTAGVGTGWAWRQYGDSRTA
jgi:hypothetical protein